MTTRDSPATAPHLAMRCDSYLDRLYAVWRRADVESHRLDDELGSEHPKAIDACERDTKAFVDLLCAEATSAQGLLLKLKIAFDYDGYFERAIDPTCKFIAPRALCSLLMDLERMARAEQDRQFSGETCPDLTV